MLHLACRVSTINRYAWSIIGRLANVSFFYLQFAVSTLGRALTKHEHQHSRGMEVCLRSIPALRTECRPAG